MDAPNDSRPGLQMPAGARRIVVLRNRGAGTGSRHQNLSKLIQQLDRAGFSAAVFESLEEAVRSAAQAQQLGELRTVITAGGDGTAALAANSFPPGTPLTIFPLGTENLMSKYLGITRDVDSMTRLIGDGIVVQFDAGEANGRIFLVMASCGFDAEVVHQLHRQRSGNISHFSYAKPILTSIRKYKYPTLTISCYGDRLKKGVKNIRAKWAFVFNLPRYASGLPIVDTACGLDGQLDVCTFRQGKLVNGLIYLAGVLFRRHRKFKDTRLLQASRIVIESREQVPYQLDGDPGGFLPLEINVLPRRLTMMVPRLWVSSRSMKIEAM